MRGRGGQARWVDGRLHCHFGDLGTHLDDLPVVGLPVDREVWALVTERSISIARRLKSLDALGVL